MPAQPRCRCAGTPALRRPRQHAACRYTGMLHESRSQRYRHTGMPEDRLEGADTDVGPLVHERRTYRPRRACGRRAPLEVGGCQDRGLAGPPRPYNRPPVRRRRDFTIRGRSFCVPAYRLTKDPAYRHTGSATNADSGAGIPAHCYTGIPASIGEPRRPVESVPPSRIRRCRDTGTRYAGVPDLRHAGVP